MSDLECIQQGKDSINLLLTTHAIIFAPMPKQSIADFTAEEEAAVIRAAKRLRYRF